MSHQEGMTSLLGFLLASRSFLFLLDLFIVFIEFTGLSLFSYRFRGYSNASDVNTPHLPPGYTVNTVERATQSTAEQELPANQH